MQVSKKELENLRYYISEKGRLIVEINKYSELFTTGYRSQDFTEPKGAGQDKNFLEKIVFKNARVQKEIEKRLKKIEVIIIKLYKIVNKIEDPELKTIVELRAIKGLTWEHIGEEVHIDKSVAFRKYKVFVEK